MVISLPGSSRDSLKRFDLIYLILFIYALNYSFELNTRLYSGSSQDAIQLQSSRFVVRFTEILWLYLK